MVNIFKEGRRVSMLKTTVSKYLGVMAYVSGTKDQIVTKLYECCGTFMKRCLKDNQRDDTTGLCCGRYMKHHESPE